MDKPIIEVEHLSKKYFINASRYGDIRTSFSRLLKGTAKDQEVFWALKDINFKVHKGETLGVIGPNGAGKSTLLKILTKITPPSAGRAILRGKVASLLEIGTGFHQELSGRENIFLNGSILGMKRREIREKFDEIVDFSGVEKFIETPVKHYSSGMYVRLAFAVAAHLEPEILLIDEVLAVGDLQFQQKCLGKMQDVASQGRTVLFVSHNLGAIQRICGKAMVLRKGQINYMGSIPEAIQRYSDGIGTEEVLEKKQLTPDLEIRQIYLLDNITNTKVGILHSGQNFKLVVSFHSKCSFDDIKMIFDFCDSAGRFLFVCNNKHFGYDLNFTKGLNVVELNIPKLPLNVGHYHINLRLAAGSKKIAGSTRLLSFKVESGPFFKTNRLPHKQNGLLVEHFWNKQME